MYLLAAVFVQNNLNPDGVADGGKTPITAYKRLSDHQLLTMDGIIDSLGTLEPFINLATSYINQYLKLW